MAQSPIAASDLQRDFAALLVESLEKAGGEGESLRAAAAAVAAALTGEEEEEGLAAALDSSGAAAALAAALLRLHPRDSNCCERVCAALAALLEAQPAAAARAVGATHWLVSALTQRGGEGPACCAAATALCALMNAPGAAGERARATSFAARCVPPLVKMMQSEEKETAAAGAAALAAAVSDHAGNATQMCDEGALVPALALLGGTQPESAFFAAAAVARAAAAGGFAIASAAEAAGFLPALTAAAALPDGHLLVRLECVKALVSLSQAFATETHSFPAAAAAAAKTAALLPLEAIVSLLRASSSRDFSLEATRAAVQMLQLRPPWPDPATMAGCRLLARMLAASCAAAEGVDALLGAACCSALLCLHLDADGAAALVNTAGAFDAMLALLQAGQEAADAAAGLLARVLGVCKPPPPPEAAAAAAEPLSALLRHEAGAVLNAQAARCVAVLAASSSGGAEAVRAAGATPLLALLLRDGPQRASGEAAALACASLARCGGSLCSRALVSAQALPALLSLCVEQPASVAAAHAVTALASIAHAGGEEALDELEVCEASVGLTAVATTAPHKSDAAQAARQLLALLDARVASSSGAVEAYTAELETGREHEETPSRDGLLLAPLRPRQFAPRLQDGAAAAGGEGRAAAALSGRLSQFSLWDEAAEAAVRNDAARREEEISRALQRRSETQRALADSRVREGRAADEERTLRQAAAYADGMHQRTAAASTEAVAALEAARAAAAPPATVALLEARADSAGAKAAAAARAARAAAQRLPAAVAALEDARTDVELRVLDLEQCSKVQPPPHRKPEVLQRGTQRAYRRH